MLSPLMVKAAEAGAVRRLVAAAARAVMHMVVLEVFARCAAGRRAAPAVARIDLPSVPRGDGLRVVPDLDELLEHGQQADPEGQGAMPAVRLQDATGVIDSTNALRLMKANCLPVDVPEQTGSPAA